MEADKEKYLTQSAYTRREAGELSPNHEDFIEMICRMGDMPVRIKNLSQWLGGVPVGGIEMRVRTARSGLLHL